MITQILFVFGAISVAFYIWQKQVYSFWKRHNVKFIEPLPIIGNLKDILSMKENLGGQIQQLYKEPGFENEPLVGIYLLGRPALLIKEPELIKRILIKDFNAFSDRFLKCDAHNDPVGNFNLFFIRNPEWKELRTKLTPVFTSGKIKQIYPLMQEIGGDLESYLDERPKESIVELKSFCGLFTTDLIATVAFGIKSNSIRNPKSEFYLQCVRTFALTFRRFIEWGIFLLMPSLARIFRIKLFPDLTTKYLRHSVKYIMDEREKSGTTRNDLIDILIDMKKKALLTPDVPNLALQHDYLVAQAAVFQTAGYDTSSSTMCFALYELALHPSMQNRLRAEIKEAFEAGNGNVSYSTIQDMIYLGQVVDETLRKHPILAFLERECTPEKGTKGYSLEPYSDFVVPAGMPVYISSFGLQRDEKHWPEPERFDPERFEPANQLNKCTYLPFGTGPHNCIGMRLGLLQTKLGLVHVLRNYRVMPCEKTLKEIIYDPRSLNTNIKGGLYLKFVRDEN